MNVVANPLEGVFVIEPPMFPDARGWFTETYTPNGPRCRQTETANHSRFSPLVVGGMR
jgi:dTDP-4-dehydrorhamnose 3,5-epimerase-like enzyme